MAVINKYATAKITECNKDVFSSKNIKTTLDSWNDKRAILNKSQWQINWIQSIEKKNNKHLLGKLWEPYHIAAGKTSENRCRRRSREKTTDSLKRYYGRKWLSKMPEIIENRHWYSTWWWRYRIQTFKFWFIISDL